MRLLLTAVDDQFSLPEDSTLVPLAVLANDVGAIPSNMEIVNHTNPNDGVVSLVDGVLHYTPDADFAGADNFTYTLLENGVDSSTANVDVFVQNSHEQAQSVINPAIAAELTPSGNFLTVEKLVQIPLGANDIQPRLNAMATFGDRTFVVADGTQNGEGLIYELVTDSAGDTLASLFLDVGAAVFQDTGRVLDNAGFGEGGIRSLAFHPEFESNGLFYSSIMEKRPADPTQHFYLNDVTTPTTRDGVLVEWTYDHDLQQIVTGSYRELFRVEAEERAHPIKEIVFDPFASVGDENYGLLFVSHGDGTPPTQTTGSGQNNDPFGKVLRINPLQDGTNNYTVPASNPFVGDANMLDEVYASGLRNPHNLTFSLDPQGVSHLIATDIGHDNFDEINVVQKGSNYGWADREGPMVHLQNLLGVNDGVDLLPVDEANAGFTYPPTFIGHQLVDGRLGLAGGHVISNGSSELDDQFIFGDFTIDGRVYHVDFSDMLQQVTSLDPNDPSRDEPGELTWLNPQELTVLFDHDNDDSTTPLVRSSLIDVLDDEPDFQVVLSDGKPRGDIRFGQGPEGELYVLNKRNGWIYLATNTVAPLKADSVFVRVDEGSVATNSGSYTELVSPNSTITASVGTVTHYGQGKWNWSLEALDGTEVSQVTITATDPLDPSTTYETRFVLQVNNVAPLHEAGPAEGLPPALAGNLSRTTPYFDPGTDTVSGTVDYGDGSGVQPLTFDTLELTYSLDHTYSSDGNYTVTVALSDEDGGTRVDTFNVYVDLNTPPVALDDVVEIAQDEPTEIGVLDDNGAGADFDVDGDVITLHSVTDPVHGSVSINAELTHIAYSPDVGFAGADTFNYTISDEFGEMATATVTVNVAATNLGLVAHWDFDTDATDQAPDGVQADDGVLDGATIVSGGLGDNALRFTADGQAMELASSADINRGVSTQSYSIWFYPEDSSIGGRQVIYQQGGTARGINVYLHGGSLYAGAWDNSAAWTGTWLVSSNYVDQQWNHVVYSIDTVAGESKLTLNGESQVGFADTLVNHNAATLGSVRLATRFDDGAGGFINSGGANSFVGGVDEVRIYDRVLSEFDIRVLGNPELRAFDPDTTSDLIAYWDFDDNALDHAIDGVFADDGSLVDAFFVEGGLGSHAMKFADDRARVELASSTDINGRFDKRTIQLWFLPEQLESAGSQMLYQQGGTARGMNLYLDNGQLVAGAWNDAAAWTGTFLVSEDVVADEWNYVAVSLDAQTNELRLYVNGAAPQIGFAAEMPPHNRASFGSVVQGTRYAPTGSPTNPASFVGYIDDARIYDRVLTQADIDSLAANTPSQIYDIETGLISYWDFDGTTNDQATTGAFADDGTLTGATLVDDPSGVGMLRFRDNGDVMDLASSPDINLAFSSKSIALWFHPMQLNGNRQVIYQQGSSVRGMNIYLENGLLKAGAWNSQVGWNGTWLSDSNVVDRQWNHVILTFDAVAGELQLVLNSGNTQVGPAFTMAGHNSATVGSSLRASRFDDGVGGFFTSSARATFDGYVDDLRIYDRVLSANDAIGLATGQTDIGLRSIKPNIVLFNLDDVDVDIMDEWAINAYFPNIKRLIQDSGTRFQNYHAVGPLCGPSRAALFRGQYPHNTGVLSNKQGWEIFYDRGYTDSEIGMWMREAGYSTALVGKYCHAEYPDAAKDGGYVPPGWDEFHASLRGFYYGIDRNINGRRFKASDDAYRTDLERDSAIQIIQAHGNSTPLFAYVAPYAVHGGALRASMVAERHLGLFNDVIIPRTPDFNEADTSDKTPQFAALPLFTQEQLDGWDEQYRDRLRAMLAVDEMVGDVFEALDEKNMSSNTYVFFTSDNGFQLTHHRDVEKKDHFDRTTRVQLLATGPGIVGGATEDHLLGHIDIIPTILELGESTIPHFSDAKSIVPLLSDAASVDGDTWQDAILIENIKGKTVNGVELDLRYVALRRHSDVYINWANGDQEYYDLEQDPYQLENSWSQLAPEFQYELALQLAAMKDCAGASCHGGANVDPVDTTLDLVDESVFSSNTVTITGTATDDVGVESVELVVRLAGHGMHQSYFDGSSLQDGYISFPATLTQPGSTLTDWSVDLTLPTAQYWISARAIDVAGNEDPLAPTAFFYVGSDTQPPTSEIVTPISGDTSSANLTISGSAMDDVRVHHVALVVRHENSGEYWNGVGYQSQYTAVAISMDDDQASTTWSHTLSDLVAGTHLVSATAIDLSGNEEVKGDFSATELPGSSAGVTFHSFDFGEIFSSSKDLLGDRDGSMYTSVNLLDSTFGNVVDTNGMAEQYVISKPEDDLALGANDSDFSVAFWLQLQSSPPSRRMIANNGNGVGDARTFGLWVQPNKRLLYQLTTVNDSAEGRYSAAQLTIGNWTHVTYVRAGGELKLYLDGVLDSTHVLSGPVVSNEGSLRLGGYRLDGTFSAADALYDDFYVVAAALTDAEIQQLATIHAGEGSVQTFDVLP